MTRSRIASLCMVTVAGLSAASAAELEILLPLNRTAYQTNETIDLSVVRSDTAALAARHLTLTLTGEQGSKLIFTFPVAAAPVQGENAVATEHLHVNGWLLRPGRYSLVVAADGATASQDIEVYSHIRTSTFRLATWGGANRKQMLVEGEDSMGFNLIMKEAGVGRDPEADSIRGGTDYLSLCTMSGGHQMDLRMECDWSDPYVTRGGTQRVVRETFSGRTRPNVIGIHFYDEPGLSASKDPATGQLTGHWIPAQRRAYFAAFGTEPPDYKKIDGTKEADVAAWTRWGKWKLSFMDSAWQEAKFGVNIVEPDWLTLVQSVYGQGAFTDGYYFNVVRSMSVTSGHGWYDDGWLFYLPSFTVEWARGRDFGKPLWHLPVWGALSSDRFRLEQYLTFMTNVQGMETPTAMDPFNPDGKPGAQGAVESNHLMGKLGTIFSTMPVTKPPVAMLYSISQLLHAQARDMSQCYAHNMTQGHCLRSMYLASKLIQQQFLFVVEEDVIDGTLAADHKAVILTGIDYLDPLVVRGLERFADGGGLVIMTSDCTVRIDGAVKLGPVPPSAEEQGFAAALKSDTPEARALVKRVLNTAFQLDRAMPLGKLVQAQLDKAGIEPIFLSDNSYIAATRQASGDIEYLFAINATPNRDPDIKELVALNGTGARIALPDNGRPVYDAVRGGVMREFRPDGNQLTASLRFGPGELRVFARTARPIGSIRALTPGIVRGLPYRTQKDSFPGRGQGVYSWQRDAIGKGQESITLIAYDTEGMSQAVGSLYEAVHGLDALTRWELPADNSITPAGEQSPVAPANVLWTALVPDRVDGLKLDESQGSREATLLVLSHDGSLSTITTDGRAQKQEVLTPEQMAACVQDFATPRPDAKTVAAVTIPTRVVKFVMTAGARTAVGYWGGTLRTYDGNKLKTQQQLPQDVTAMASLGDRLIVGLADGQVLALELK